MTFNNSTTTRVDTIETLPDDKLITGQELFAAGNLGPGELVKGAFIQMTPPGFLHGLIEVNVSSILRSFVRKHKLGYVLAGEAGVYTRRNPDTVRGMDVAFISYERMAQVESESYLDVAPELIVEILSPSDRWDNVNDKIAEYFDIGALAVWVLDPKRKQVHLYRAPTEVEILTAVDELTGNSILPGFSISVAELFARE